MFRREYYGGLSEQKGSLLLRLLVPTIGVMLAQVLMISLVLFMNGTVSSLEQNAKDSLARNAENRSLTLENSMVRNWSNLDTLEEELLNIVAQYEAEHDVTIQDICGTSDHERALLAEMKDKLLGSLQSGAATGTFIFLTDAADAELGAVALNGLYYRDSNPSVVSYDYADISLEVGPMSFAQADNIQTFSNWEDKYNCSVEDGEAWDAIYAPIHMAAAHPKLSAGDLARWSAPHFLHVSKPDTEPCITYTRPLIYDGRVIGVFGTEITTKHFLSFFPAGDIGQYSGYLLVRYDAPSEGGEVLAVDVFAATSSYIKRLTDAGQTLLLSQTEDSWFFTAENERFGQAYTFLRPLALYSRNAPFSHEQWALLAVSSSDQLFESAQNVRNGVLQSSIFALVLGTILIVLTIRHLTKPLLSIAKQIVENSPDDPVVVQNAKTYEIVLLCDTINEMKTRRRASENALLEERERYMVALESATDTFIEYEKAADRFTINYFVEEDGKPVLTSHSYDNFTQTVKNNGICHPADAQALLQALRGTKEHAPIEVRLRTEMFPHVRDEEADGEYYWFLFKAVPIAHGGEGGEAGKMIGSARQITAEKLAAFAQMEAKHRDVTTGLYNREYGELLFERMADTAAAAGEAYSILVADVEQFDRFEAYYGQIYSAMILREISKEVQRALPEESGDEKMENAVRRRVVRWNADKLAAFCRGFDPGTARMWIDDACRRIYTGENKEMPLRVRTSVYSDFDTFAAENAVRRPANVAVEVSAETVVGFALDMFEHSTDMTSVIQMLFRALGEVFGISRVMICEYDKDFGASKVTHQWSESGVSMYHDEVTRFSHVEFTALEQLLGETGMLMYHSEDARAFDDGVRRLLCVQEGLPFSAMCCAMHETGVHTGHVLFTALGKSYDWTDAKQHSLYEITKIISTYFSLERSNSASRAKSEFLSRMSHEIRTPMNAIIGMTRIAKEAGEDAERVTDSLEKIDASAKHLLALINDILDMSRIESGKMEVSTLSFDMAALAEQMDALMRPPLEEKNIRFTVDCRAERPCVLGDEQKLRQVLINLLGNALKFTPEGCAVALSIVQEMTDVEGFCNVRFAVKDTGVGIAEEDREKIFNAFEQSATGHSAVTHAKGTGLGLAISSGLVSAMGGRIELVSEPGVGSEFFFSLPMTYEQAAVPVEEAAEEENPDERFRGKRVLIVDDTEINLEIAAYLVESVGFTVETAMDGREAVDMFFASDIGYYDVIFMDINMPVLDGLEATREIRRDNTRPDTRTVPILAMTANAFSEDTKKSIESGMNAHVAKPIDTEFLYATLDKLVLGR